MIFYSDTYYYNLIETLECEIIEIVTISLYGAGKMEICDSHHNGQLFQADESFPTYCKLVYGFEPAAISDEEFRQLCIDRITFFSKARTRALRNIIYASRSKKINNG